jgi:hypothetical protein
VHNGLVKSSSLTVVFVERALSAYIHDLVTMRIARSLLPALQLSAHCYSSCCYPYATQQDELAVLRSNRDDSVPWLPLQVVTYKTKSSGGAEAALRVHGVPVLTYVLCTDEASDVLRRVALRRPDMLAGASPAATSAATSDTDSSEGLPRTVLLWATRVVHIDKVSCAVHGVCVCW